MRWCCLPDGKQVFASVYGGGIFGKNANPDRRIAVIDLETKSLARMIEVAEGVAPHGVMMDRDGMLWCTAELANAALAIDPATGAVADASIPKRPRIGWSSAMRRIASSPPARPRISWR